MNNDYAMSCVDLSRVFYRFLKIFCNDNLGSRAHARDGARPWDVTLKGLDAVMELMTSQAGLVCIVSRGLLCSGFLIHTHETPCPKNLLARKSEKALIRFR